MSDATQPDANKTTSRDPTLTPWRKEPWSHLIDWGAALFWRVRWSFRWVWLITKGIPWPLRLVGWLAVYWSLGRAIYTLITGGYGETPWRDLGGAVWDFTLALPDQVDALIAQTPGTVWSLIRAAPGQWADILAALTLLAFLVAAWTVLRDLRREAIIVEPFSMPEALVKQGHDPIAFTRRLMAAVERDAVEAYEDWGALGSGLAGETPDLELPAGRLSLSRVTQILRHACLAAPALRLLLGVQPERTIVGSVSANGEGEDAALTLHAALKNWPGTDITRSANAIDALITAAAPDLIEIIDPHRRIAQLAKSDPDEGEAVIVRTRQRLAACPWGLSKRERQGVVRLTLNLAFLQDADGSGRTDRIANWLRSSHAGPYGAASWSDRALALATVGDHKAALKAYARALCGQPFDATAHNNRGNRLAALGRHEDALLGYDRAIEIKPDYANALFNAALELCALDTGDQSAPLRLERARKAVHYAETYVRLRPDADDHWILGRAKSLLARVEAEIDAEDDA